MSYLAELLKKKAASLTPANIPVPSISQEIATLEATSTPSSPATPATVRSLDATSEYNEEQLRFINLVLSGESCILIGAAGTGKTTCMRGVINKLVALNPKNVIGHTEHKAMTEPNAPDIAAVSFTRRAVANLRRAMPPAMYTQTMTIHKLLEYAPVKYEVWNEELCKMVNTMTFEPSRNLDNPLPDTLRTVIIDESSMVSTQLFREIIQATPTDVKLQFIFLGDIQQLPPVFGSAILGYKMLELPTVELTQVYRQALDAPNLKLAHRILSGVPIPLAEYPSWNVEGRLKITPWVKKTDPTEALLTVVSLFKKLAESQNYNPEEDAILIPYNVGFGTVDFNRYIATYYAHKEGRIVWEIVAGFETKYFSVGDKVLHEKEDAIILSIKPNPLYMGKPAAKESKTLDYFGYDTCKTKAAKVAELGAADLDAMLGVMASASEDRVHQGSHIVELQMLDSNRTLQIKNAADINQLLLGYAITVHKSQGSEWNKVFLLIHHTHSKMIQRELLYTAVTRARQELVIICEADTFTKGILSQKIKGNTLAEKAEFFKGKVTEGAYTLD